MSEGRLFCANCGVESPVGSQFCPNCGASTDPSHADQYMEVDADIQDFVGENKAYYMAVFRKLRLTRTKFSWNWVAFFFPAYWLAYRKMYLFAVAVFLTQMLLSVVPVFSTPTLLIMLAMGAFGNSLYMFYVEKEVRVASYMSEDAKYMRIRSRGGVNWLPVIGLLAVQIAFSVLMAVLRLSSAVISGLFDWIF